MGYKLLIIILIAILATTPSIGQTTFDPMSIGVGARALGMGKAYVAVAENCDAIFTNPAGLGETDSFKFTSMSGKILEEVNYTLLGSVYPLGEKSAIGIGFVSSAVGNIELYDSAGVLSGRSSFENNLLFASYGKKLSEKISLGINLKYYYQKGSANSSGDGSGLNIDIGFLQRDLGWLSLGIVGQNILTSGKINYGNGEKQSLPSTLKVGTNMYILGQKFQAARIAPIDVRVMLDADLGLQSSEPNSTHIGVEISPSTNLTLRAGIDQDPKPGGAQNNFTSGVSLKYAGLGFHYAYHPYGEAADITHFFSISFDELGWPPEGPPDVFLGSR